MIVLFRFQINIQFGDTQMKAYLIDPFNKSITETEHEGGFKEIQKTIDANVVDTLCINKEHDTLYLDDVGLLVTVDKQEFFLLPHYPVLLGGKTLVLGTDSEGNLTSPIAPIEWFQREIYFIPKDYILKMKYLKSTIQGTTMMSIEAGRKVNGVYYLSSLFADKWFLALEVKELAQAHNLSENLRKKHKIKVTMILPGVSGSFQEELERKFPVMEYNYRTRKQ